MKISIKILQVFLGLFLILNGLNMWFHFLPVQVPESVQANKLMEGLVVSGMFALVKYVEIISGVLLVLNRFVPFALVIMLPLTVVIFWVDFGLIQSANSMKFGTLLVVPHLILLLLYMRNFLPVLAMNSEPKLVSIDEIKAAALNSAKK